MCAVYRQVRDHRVMTGSICSKSDARLRRIDSTTATMKTVPHETVCRTIEACLVRPKPKLTHSFVVANVVFSGTALLYTARLQFVFDIYQVLFIETFKIVAIGSPLHTTLHSIDIEYGSFFFCR